VESSEPGAGLPVLRHGRPRRAGWRDRTIREHDLVTRLREFAETHRDWKQSGSQ